MQYGGKGHDRAYRDRTATAADGDSNPDSLLPDEDSNLDTQIQILESCLVRRSGIAT
jgi:hypothetical protein